MKHLAIAHFEEMLLFPDGFKRMEQDKIKLKRYNYIKQNVSKARSECETRMFARRNSLLFL